MAVVPPAIAERYVRTAKRLFGVRSDNYEVSPTMPALLYAQDLRKHEGLSNEDAALVARDVFPDADPDELLKLLASSEGSPTGGS